MPDPDKTIQDFSLNVSTLPLSDEAKKRIVRDFRLALLRELATHDEGLDGVLVFHGPINGGKIIRDVRAVADLKVSELTNTRVIR